MCVCVCLICLRRGEWVSNQPCWKLALTERVGQSLLRGVKEAGYPRCHQTKQQQNNCQLGLNPLLIRWNFLCRLCPWPHFSHLFIDAPLQYWLYCHLEIGIHCEDGTQAYFSRSSLFPTIAKLIYSLPSAEQEYRDHRSSISVHLLIITSPAF